MLACSSPPHIEEYARGLSARKLVSLPNWYVISRDGIVRRPKFDRFSCSTADCPDLSLPFSAERVP